ncbi:MAG: N-formylglutamate amidohydrolase [Treponema sp.]|nr:N-formylglutamate amidohydrolase [Treponema sp.]
MNLNSRGGAMNKDCIILHIPHSSLAVPEEALHQYDAGFLQEELLLMADRYTDELFGLPYTSIIFPYSRLFCDVERFRDDAQEEMSRKGMGVVYTRTHDNIEYRKVTSEEKRKILSAYYDVHHQKFEKLVDEKLNEYGEALIIDSHSFNPYPLPHEKDKTQRPDICIGLDEFHTDKKLAFYLKDFFERKKYSVKINSPFQGSIVPLKHYGRNKNVTSIMIELNRKLYMNEHGEKIENFQKLKDDISEIILSL